MHFTNIAPGPRRKVYERDKVFAVGAETHTSRWVWNRRKAGAVAAHRAYENMRQLVF
jgi:K+/H+ antiporter YhaU regulatory subunit KhtT